MKNAIIQAQSKGSYQNNINYLPEVILERDKERRVKRSQSATEAMSDTVAAQKRPGPSGGPVFGPLRRLFLGYVPQRAHCPRRTLH
ncbi:hypothetical protein B9J77_02720 [candidate division NPL-UPA2 bacterium Unc8]|uniref:Uncharacterized protein n=1 Tax=candidate division NPL-UPA2 bacterium Unc8 TaxID=1980939 RepID=A0A399FYX7_UNCN2|nr:MAG: hypothetical protein B9J77_02720 [candidate division NPL-UPA2 bacterium Unc8]